MLKKLLKMRNKKGFTLIELIVVLVIMAILAAAAIPTMMGYVENAKKAQYLANCRAVYVAGQAATTEALGNDLTVTGVDSDINKATPATKWSERVAAMTEITGLAAKLKTGAPTAEGEYGVTFDGKGNVTKVSYMYKTDKTVDLTPGTGTNVMD